MLVLMESSDNENHSTKFVNDLEIIEEKAAAEGEEQEKAEGEGEKAGGEEGKKAGEGEQEKAEGEGEGEGEETKQKQGEHWIKYWRYIPLVNAALRGDWDSTKRFFDQDADALTAHINFQNETALHVAITSGRSIEFVEKLVDLMPPEALVQPRGVGVIALHQAAMIGNTKAAAILAGRHPASLYIRDNGNWLPLHFAASFGNKDTLLYLLSVTKDDPVSMPFAYHSGALLLSAVMESEFYGEGARFDGDVRREGDNGYRLR